MKKTALVFSGGGSRGSYEIGVWKALNKLKIKPDMVFGSSVGAINAALFASNSVKK
jgi:NTE family protein